MNEPCAECDSYRQAPYEADPCCAHPAHVGACTAIGEGKRCPNFSTCSGVLWRGCRCVEHVDSLFCDGGCIEYFYPCHCYVCPKCGRTWECRCAT